MTEKAFQELCKLTVQSSGRSISNIAKEIPKAYNKGVGVTRQRAWYAINKCLSSDTRIRIEIMYLLTGKRYKAQETIEIIEETE